jgi:uncharacterized protein YkwD
MPAIQQFNWIDWISLLVFIFAVVEGWRLGFVHLVASFTAYAVSIWVAFRFHTDFTQFLMTNIGLSNTWISTIAFILLVLFAQVVFTQFFMVILGKLAQKIMASRIDNLLGSVLSLANAIIILSIFYYLVFAVPILPSVKRDVNNSYIAGKLNLVLKTYLRDFQLPLQSPVDEAKKLVTLGTDDKKMIYLSNHPQRWNMLEDTQSEAKLLVLVNAERQKNNLIILSVNPKLTDVAQKYSLQMFEQQFISHTDKDGNTTKDRLEQAGIPFVYAGENLVLSPDVTLAHSGLMNSRSHRENILNPVFRQIGIGIIDGGEAGLMITELFIN